MIIRRLTAPLVASVAIASALSLAPATSAATAATAARIAQVSQQAHRGSATPTSLNGRELWATVNVCTSKPKALIGIRGSMPANGQSQDTMYMLFRVQYLDPATKRWTNLGSGGESGLVRVGRADATRQAGRTFDLSIPGRHSTFQMRGTVEFQWRHGSHVALSTTRLTSSGHHSTAGAMPRGYSASTCTVSNG